MNWMMTLNSISRFWSIISTPGAIFKLRCFYEDADPDSDSPSYVTFWAPFIRKMSGAVKNPARSPPMPLFAPSRATNALIAFGHVVDRPVLGPVTHVAAHSPP